MNTASNSSNPYTELGSAEKGTSNPSLKAHKQMIALQTVIFALCLAVVTLTISNIYFAVSRQPRDYVVEVDANKRVLYGGYLDEQVKDWTIYMPNVLSQFVENWRQVTGDNTMQKIAANRLYCMLLPDSAASTRMDEYYKDPENDPFEVNQDRTRTVSMRTLLRQQNSNTWQVEFSETTRNHSGDVIGKDRIYKAQLVVTRGMTKDSCITSNPLGAYVTDINWTTVL